MNQPWIILNAEGDAWCWVPLDMDSYSEGSELALAICKRFNLDKVTLARHDGVHDSPARQEGTEQTWHIQNVLTAVRDTPIPKWAWRRGTLCADEYWSPIPPVLSSLRTDDPQEIAFLVSSYLEINDDFIWVCQVDPDAETGTQPLTHVRDVWGNLTKTRSQTVVGYRVHLKRTLEKITKR